MGYYLYKEFLKFYL
ncbi:uncharacterized protein FFFS_01676 [Fusarium fujikuroi]|nr:uncharacterized protein FFFS_01676 [Fusarium fujikuroi]